MGVNAFQTTAFQQTVGYVAFQELTSAVVVTSGRQITEQEVQESLKKTWRYKEDINSLYRHIAAVHLGRKGGYAKSNFR